jgi:hypothetical protein
MSFAPESKWLARKDPFEPDLYAKQEINNTVPKKITVVAGSLRERSLVCYTYCMQWPGYEWAPFVSLPPPRPKKSKSGCLLFAAPSLASNRLLGLWADESTEPMGA